MPSEQDFIDKNDLSGNVNNVSVDAENGADAGSAPSGRQSRLISRVLAPAVGLWLRSQLDHVEDLHIAIEAGDRQLLSGGISQVSASASKAVYQGLHLSQIQVVGQQIQTNLGQVLRGKPFRLLASFPVLGEISLSEADLNASLLAPLLANAVTDFLLTLLQINPDDQPEAVALAPTLRALSARLEDQQIFFSGSLVTHTAEVPIEIRTGLTVENGNLLKLEGFECTGGLLSEQQDTLNSLPAMTFPLGSDVFLEELAVSQGKISCRGRITVIP